MTHQNPLKLFLTVAAILVLPSFTFAAPIGGAGLVGLTDSNPLVQEARLRVFCYNRRSGRFLHWGSCRRRVVVRYYCKNRYTGRFLYWGRCRR